MPGNLGYSLSILDIFLVFPGSDIFAARYYDFVAVLSVYESNEKKAEKFFYLQ